MQCWSVYGGLLCGWLWLVHLQDLALLSIGLHLGAGLCLWTLVEYILHRWILHFDTKEGWRYQLAKQWHLDHHEHPDDPHRLLIDLRASLPLYVLFLASFYLLTDIWHAGLLVSGLTIGYLIYEGIHVMAHQQSPQSRLGRALKRYHLIHHFAEPDRAFGVTTPLWDVIFRTRPKRRAPVASVPSSSSANP
jgi:dihydroceramide fatty acyl 2-hydroxylase